MANYYPYGYSPYVPYQQNVQQNPQQTPSSMIWVRNAQEAAMYPVAPNNAVALWDSGVSCIYLKQADASGRPTMKVYDLVERAETPENTSGGTSSDYATKAELSALAVAVKDVDGLITEIRADIEKLKDKKSDIDLLKEEKDG